ncbi:MAG: flagellar assembly protein FliW [Desulfobacter sp.]|nr:MAG: flagellar assembly protein FliW [Desulfobacter sp.]
MKLATLKYGEIEIDDATILSMPEGLPGFEGLEKFVLIEDPQSSPFCWFQSVEDPNLSLVVMDPLVFKPDYRIQLNGVIRDMGWQGVEEKDLYIYVVINIFGNKEKRKITANLMGPLVINLNAGQAVQAVLPDSGYESQYVILDTSSAKE